MGLLSIIRKAKAKEGEVRILMLGLDNAGKTTVVKKFLDKDTSTISPTLGFQICPIQYKNKTLNIWDIGGQQTLRSFWKNYFESTDGIIWVVDSNDVGRLHDCRDELHKLLGEERLAGASLLIFLNKVDIPTALDASEIEKILEVEKIRGQKRHVQLVRCSAMTGEGLLKGVDWIVSDICSRMCVS